MDVFLKEHGALKLQIELVPDSCWYANVRSNVKQSQWNKIRATVYQKANYLCEVCGGKGRRHPVECHEVWEYDETTGIQRLAYFQALCPLCHEVKHFGFAQVRGNGDRAFKRFCSVNNIQEYEAGKIIEAIRKQWEIRSRMEWNLDITLLKEYGIEHT